MSSLRASAIKVGYLKSMLHMRHYMTRGMADTKAMRWGRLVHMAVLEPDKLPAMWQGKKREGKQWDAFIDTVLPGVEISTPDEWCEVQNCRAAIMQNKRAVELLENTKRELSVEYVDSELGKCTARFDAWKPGVMIDLKTTTRVDSRSIGKLFAQMAYHLQFGFYDWIADKVGLDHLPDCYSIAVEADPPYDNAVYKLSKMDVMSGMNEAVKIGARYRACEQASYWPGCQEKEEVIELPEWAYRDAVAPVDSGDIGEL